MTMTLLLLATFLFFAEVVSAITADAGKAGGGDRKIRSGAILATDHCPDRTGDLQHIKCTNTC